MHSQSYKTNWIKLALAVLVQSGLVCGSGFFSQFWVLALACGTWLIKPLQPNPDLRSQCDNGYLVVEDLGAVFVVFRQRLRFWVLFQSS